MKIESLHIVNFRGIKEVSLESLGSIVIIAGQNGSGKSCIFDAIRLLKSVYGGYQANEWQQWMGEFQISLTDKSSDFISMFNDRTKELRITCEFKLAEEERKYIVNNAKDLLAEKIWRTILPEAYSWGGLRMAMFAAQFRDRQPEVLMRVEHEYHQLIEELEHPTIIGEFFIVPGDLPQINQSLALSVVFSNFRPSEIGVIDYHGAQRHYGRENVQGINMNLESIEQQRSQSALYNYAIKYTNVKGEMATSYIKEMLAEKAGIPIDQQSSLTNTLKELFVTFFPDKKFDGPQATINGALSFPVQTTSGAVHDLDELSSGEKEILYGYLRIRNSAPRYSIILLDEPELHLNPRLIRGLPQFYKKNLGEALENQIWLVTHSDALLREVVGQENYNVYHMVPSGNVEDNESQLKQLSATEDLDLALVDLVGDLASFKPGGKVIIFEGGGDSDFDQRVISALFPKLQEEANLISGSNKSRVKALQEILAKAAAAGKLPFKFYSVTDKDSDSTTQNSDNTFAWDVYHIENYFLEVSFIHKVLTDLQINTAMDESMIFNELKNCAEATVTQLIQHELAIYANNLLVKSINTSADPKTTDISQALFNSINHSMNRLHALHTTDLSESKLRSMESEISLKYRQSFQDETWPKKVRGRDVLKRFVSKYGSGVSYEVFRNLILSKMRDQGYQPDGMKKIIESIIKQ